MSSDAKRVSLFCLASYAHRAKDGTRGRDRVFASCPPAMPDPLAPSRGPFVYMRECGSMVTTVTSPTIERLLWDAVSAFAFNRATDRRVQLLIERVNAKAAKVRAKAERLTKAREKTAVA
jgi:hypothetical protein